jgi:hypothetical protein
VFAFGYFHPILSLIAGILILIIPRLLNYIVAIYLILFGILGIQPDGILNACTTNVLIKRAITIAMTIGSKYSFMNFFIRVQGPHLCISIP